MNKPRILLDCDGILSDFHTPCLAIINELTGKNYSLADVTDWNIFNALGIEGDVKKATYDRMNTPGWCSALQPYDGSAQGVEELRKIGDVHIVTSPMRGDTWHREREQWLWKHFGFDTKKVHHTGSKYVIHGDVLIDDRDDNLVAWKHEPVNQYGIAIKWVTYPNQPNHYVGQYYQDWPTLLEYLRERFEVEGEGDEA